MESEDLEDFTEVVRSGKGTKPRLIKSKKNVYEKPKELGKGGYGKVYKYFSRKTDHTVIVKVFNTVKKTKTDCISTGKLLSPRCMKSKRNHVLEQRCLGDILLMKEMDGDLIDFFHDRGEFATPGLAETCIKQLASGLACVEKSKGWYTDVKPENILWKVERSAPYFCLGDLDFCRDHAKALTTYSPPEGGGRACSEGGSVWGFGLLVMWIMHQVNPKKHADPYELHWTHAKTQGLTDDEYKDLKKSVIRKYKRIIDGFRLTKKSKDLVKRMVDYRNASRPSIKEINTQGVVRKRRGPK